MNSSPGEHGIAMSVDVSAEAVISGQNLLILASSPSEESALCGGLVSWCCRRGRGPYIVVLTRHCDASETLPRPSRKVMERATRSAVEHLGLPEERLFMIDLPDATLVQSGPEQEGLVRAIMLLMWRHDCSIVCAPWSESPRPDQTMTFRLAAAISEASGVDFLAYAAEWELSERLMPPHWELFRLDTEAERSNRSAALESYGHAGLIELSSSASEQGRPDSEIILRPRSPRALSASLQGL